MVRERRVAQPRSHGFSAFQQGQCANLLCRAEAEGKEVRRPHMPSNAPFSRRPYGDAPRGWKRAIIKALIFGHPEATHP